MTGPSLKPNSLTIIVPVYNDKDSILQTKTRLEKVLSDQPFESRVLFVDDGSTDGARDLLREHGIDHVAHERNQGYGAAIKTGAQHVKTEFLAIIDCDGSYPPEEIPRLMECAPDYDMVVGARDVRINPPLHRMAKRVVCHVLTALFDQNVRDINSGLRIFRTKVFREYSPGLCDRFSLTSSVTYGFLLDKRPIKYLPIAYHKRVGESKVRRVSFTKSFLESLVVMRRFCLARRAQAGESQETPPPQSRVRKIGPPLAVFLLGLLFAAFFMWPQLRDPYASHGDVFQHTWWMVTYHHPELYPGDPYVTYARSLSTPGFQALYFVATWFIDPILFGKLLSLVLYSLTGMLFFLLGRFYGGKWVGLLIALAFLAYPDSFDEFEGGLHRSFMFPLTLLFFYLLTLRRPRFFGWLFALQILVYPISFVLSLGVLMTAFAGRYIRPLSLFRSKVAVAGYIALILSALILVQVRQAQKPSFLGKMATAQQMQNDPAFYEGGGRASYFPIPLLKDFTWHKMYRSREYVLFCSALAFLFLLAQWLKGREVDAIWRPWLILLLASILLFEISKLVMFKLYIPDRYVQYSFWMLGSIQFGLGVAGILMVLRRPLKIAFSVLLLVAVLIDLHGEVGHVHKSSIRHSDPAYPALFEFLRNTPVDTMIAAPPEVADRITAHTHRKTLTRYELSHPWYENWRAMMEERALDYWTAYYTSDPDVFLDFLRKWDIEYFVTTAGYSNILSKKNLDFFYDPLNHRIFELAFSSVHRETVLEASSDAFLVFDRDRHRVYHFPKTWTASPQAHEDLLRLTSVTSPAVAEE